MSNTTRCCGRNQISRNTWGHRGWNLDIGCVAAAMREVSSQPSEGWADIPTRAHHSKSSSGVSLHESKCSHVYCFPQQAVTTPCNEVETMANSWDTVLCASTAVPWSSQNCPTITLVGTGIEQLSPIPHVHVFSRRRSAAYWSFSHSNIYFRTVGIYVHINQRYHSSVTVYICTRFRVVQDECIDSIEG